MAKEPTSMYGHMMVAAQKTFLAPVRFVANAGMQALERLIPHGAAEIGAAFYGNGNAYSPPGVTERLTPPQPATPIAPPVRQPAQDYTPRIEAAAARGAGRSSGREGMER